MSDRARAVAGAFAYAWWLTGNEACAESIVRELVHAAPAELQDDGARLLGEVRSRAITERTMCPASELALLHDGHELALPDAARLCEVDERDARSELAHGRLEALLDAPEATFAHPERLGGLAVGNPADIAHARQCDSCGDVRDLLERGREELGAVAAAVIAEHPGDLLAAHASPTGAETTTGPAEEAVATTAQDLTVANRAAAPDDEPRLSDRPQAKPSRIPAVIAALAALALALLALIQVANSEPSPAGSFLNTPTEVPFDRQTAWQQVDDRG